MSKALEEDNHRDLVFEYPHLAGAGVSNGQPLDFTGSPNPGWEFMPSTGLYLYESTIDLSGYAMEDLTMYPEYVFTQENFFFTNASLRAIDQTRNGSTYEYVLITTVPVKDFDDIFLQNGQSFYGFGGFLGGALTPEQVIYGKVRSFAPNLNIPLTTEQITANENIWGSMAPTAADKLYFYRLISFQGALGYQSPFMSAPAGRLIMPVKIAREPDLEYMMRLKRSYELANQV